MAHSERNRNGKETQTMLTLIIVLALFIVLDVAALRWGVDSTEAFTSAEWERRLNWMH